MATKLQAVAIVLDFVNPAGAGGRRGRNGWPQGSMNPGGTRACLHSAGP
jgi:hypothetical protein